MKKSLIRSDVELQEGPFKGQDLNTYLYMNLPSVYLFRMSSNVMHEDGILEGDVVIVDRSLLIENGDYVVMSINGTFLLRQFLDGREPRLVCADDSIPDINLTHVDECELFGVVSSVIRKTRIKKNGKQNPYTFRRKNKVYPKDPNDNGRNFMQKAIFLQESLTFSLYH